jgi:hypothetical protein
MASVLLEKETLTESEIKALVGGRSTAAVAAD